ncbi:WG repeat-containing protein [Cohnella sp.]|uniref:WG repeat-containing protein n=1 Tax=Cohnella sp. TaxID=1883426 RepID=UPI00356A0FA6
MHGYIDLGGNQVIPPIYDNATSFRNGIAAVRLDNKTRFISCSGETVLETNILNVGNFNDGRALFQTNGKFGYLDMQGNVVIPPRFEYAYDFSEGYAAVAVSEGSAGGIAFIDVHGEFIHKRVYVDAMHFRDGIVSVKHHSSGKYGCINATGEYVIDPISDRYICFSEGLASIEVNGKIGYINHQGEIVITPRFAYASDFHNGFAIIMKRNKFGYINQVGEIIIDTVFNDAEDYYDQLAPVKLGKTWGYLNPKGEFEIQRLEYFSEGLSLVTVREKRNKYAVTKHSNF